MSSNAYAQLHKDKIGNAWHYAVAAYPADGLASLVREEIDSNGAWRHDASLHYVADTVIANAGYKRVSEWRSDPWGYQTADIEEGEWKPDVSDYGFITASV